MCDCSRVQTTTAKLRAFRDRHYDALTFDAILVTIAFALAVLATVIL